MIVDVETLPFMPSSAHFSEMALTILNTFFYFDS